MVLIRRIVACVSMFCVFAVCSYSQSEWSDWQENITDDESLAGWQEEYQELAELAENPFNINTLNSATL